MRPLFSFRLVTIGLAVLFLPTSGSGLRHGGGPAALAAGAVPNTKVSEKSSVPLSTLWNATTHNSGAYTSSFDYGTLYPNISAQAADDFQVSTAAIWHIDSVTVVGQYVDGSTNTIDSALLQIYVDTGGNRPGQLFYSQRFASGSIGGVSTGTLVFTISPSFVVGPGHYWLSVQAARQLTGGDLTQWVWSESTEQQLAESVWQQPGNGYGTGCTTWAPRYTVCNRPSQSALDQVFKIEGTSTPILAQVFLPVLSR